MNAGSYITEARAAWKLLNGVICVYKPVGMHSFQLQREVRNKLAKCLNFMKVREPETIVEVRRIEDTISPPSTDPNLETHLSVEDRGVPKSDFGKLFAKEIVAEFPDGPDTIQIVKGSNYADHTLVVGPRYQPLDIKLFDISRIGVNSSGLSVLGINRGIRTAQTLHQLQWLRTYVLSARFGIATSTGFHTGRIIDKATYHKISKLSLDRFLSTTQSNHQKNMFIASGVPLTSERAYELACKGLPRPDGHTTPLVYSLKCTKFEPPDFDIEVAVINENEDFLKGLIHDTGIRLHSAAVCTKIRSVRFGPFGLDLALLSKHFEPQHIINNIIKTSEILKGVNLRVREPTVTNPTSGSPVSNQNEISPLDKLQHKVECI